MKLTVRNLHGDIYTFEIAENETVKALKDQIAARDDLKEKYIADLIKLLYKGKSMEDEEMLNTFDIKPEGFLVLVKQTPGKPKPPPKKKPNQNFGNMMGGFNSPFGGMSQMPHSMMSQPFSNNLFDQSFKSSQFMPSTFPQSPMSSQPFSPSTFQSPTNFPGMGSTNHSVNSTEDPFTSNEDREQAVEQLVQMGFDRRKSEKVLRVCHYNIEAATEALLSDFTPPDDDVSLPPITGLPPTPTLTLPSMPAQTSNTSFKPQPQSPSTPSNNPSQGDTGMGLNLQELGRTLRDHPERLQDLKEKLKSQHPEIAQVIEDDPQAFIDMVCQAAAAGDETPTTNTPNTNIPSTNASNPLSVGATLKPHEEQAIKRIEEMGFERNRVIEAFLTCERNEELAVHYLLNAF